LNDIPVSILIGCVCFLVFLSAFFSSSETSMMALNRYRLRHLEKKGHKGAKRAASLLRRPDRLIGVILIGNNLVNTFATALTTIIALRLYGEVGVWYATLILTIVILIFSEITPKTIAALHPEKVAFPFSLILQPLLKVLYPAVWSVKVVDEYGEVQGLVTLADLLEEIVGDFTTNFANTHEPTIIDNEDDWYTFDGGASIREINKSLSWNLPTNGPKTLNGLFMEHLEIIPKGPVSFAIEDYRFETQKISKTMIETAKGQLVISASE